MKDREKTRRRIRKLTVLLTALAVLMAAGTLAAAKPALSGERTEQACVETAQQEPARVHSLQPAAMPEAPVEEITAPEEAEIQDPTVPETAAVEDGYFNDAVFLGDSRTEGFSLYSGLKEGAYFFAVGATVESVFTKQTQKTASGRVSLLDAMASVECGKVYIMLGINELGWPRADKFKEQYGKVIDRVREDHSGAEVVIQSILPVSARQDAKGSYVNNERIATFNGLLKELAEEKSCPYLDVASAVTGEDGCLKADLTFDGIHLNTDGCKLWLEYLRTHTV